MNAWDNPLWVQGMIIIGALATPFFLYGLWWMKKRMNEYGPEVSPLGGLRFP